MSTNSTSIRTARIAQRVRDRNNRPQPTGAAAEPSPTDNPYWLLWSSGVVAAVLCIVALVLWGIYGANTLFDVTVAFCI